MACVEPPAKRSRPKRATRAINVVHAPSKTLPIAIAGTAGPSMGKAGWSRYGMLLPRRRTDSRWRRWPNAGSPSTTLYYLPTSTDKRRLALIRTTVQDLRQRGVDVRPAAGKCAGCCLPIGEMQGDQSVQVFRPPLDSLQPWKILAP